MQDVLPVGRVQRGGVHLDEEVVEGGQRLLRDCPPGRVGVDDERAVCGWERHVFGDLEDVCVGFCGDNLRLDARLKYHGRWADHRRFESNAGPGGR